MPPIIANINGTPSVAALTADAGVPPAAIQTAVDAGGTPDALVLQAIANIDASRADLHADATIDAISLANGARIDPLAPRTTGFAPLLIVGNDQRVRIEHHRLEPRIGTHIRAHLLPHHPGHEVGETPIEEDPEQFPGSEAEGHGFMDELAHRGEIANEGKAGPQGNQGPGTVLGPLDAELADSHRLLVQLHALVAVTLDLHLDPLKDLGIDRLGTSVAAPQSSGDRGEEEQRIRGDDEKNGQKEHVLRPEHPTKNVELALRQMEQEGLSTIPLEPRQAVEKDLRKTY